MTSSSGGCLVPPVLRLEPEIALMIADEMDILSLSRWRTTCYTNYRYGCSSMRRTLTIRLKTFVPHPNQLVDLVTRQGAVFGGQVALSFVLRETPLSLTSVDIFTSNFAYAGVCEAILDNLPTADSIERQTFLPSTPFHALRWLVAETLTIRLSDGKVIYVHQSLTSSPAAPISRSPCSALSNFVTAYSFGCSHPELTLSRRALLADRDLQHMSPSDARSLSLLLRSHFSLAVSPTAWPEYRRFGEDSLQSPEECWRDRYICPNQGRYFGDKGSMVCFFDPLAGDEEECTRNNIAPFGPMVIWRLMSTFECDDGCEYLDDAIDVDATCIPVLFKKDPYGELYDFISDAHLPSGSMYRKFGRNLTPWS